MNSFSLDQPSLKDPTPLTIEGTRALVDRYHALKRYFMEIKGSTGGGCRPRIELTLLVPHPPKTKPVDS